MATLKSVVLLICGVCFAAHDALGADCPEPACFTSPPMLVVGAPPGGQIDSLARSLAASMSNYLQQPVIVDNKAGAAGNYAAELVAKSYKNGQTILIASTAVLTLNDKIFKTLTFDVRKDFAPVALVASAPQLLLVNLDVQAKSLKEFVALAKGKPGGITFASPGGGSLSHLVMEQLKYAAGIQLVHVPYRGAAPAITDLLGGQVQAMIVDAGSGMQYVQSGKLRALAITGAKRSPLASNVPTFDEEGFKGFESGVAYGLVYPAGTHPNIVSRLNTAVRKSLERSEFKDYLAKSGFEAANPAPEAFANHLRSENERWAKVVKASGIQLD